MISGVIAFSKRHVLSTTLGVCIYNSSLIWLKSEDTTIWDLSSQHRKRQNIFWPILGFFSDDENLKGGLI